MARPAGERVSILTSDQRDLTHAFLGALRQADAELPCRTASNSTLAESFPSQEPDRG
jgi:non-ribosomal peptide synthetase component F